jgi:hypothetical protein
VENFCQHIEKLLVQHDYVVVPNLGGFVVQKHSAQLLHDRIVPPMAVVSFNPLMQYADGLLAIEIARSEQISYRQAVERIDNSVIQLWADLRSNGRAQLGNLGKLIYGGQNSLTFIPNKKAAFLPQNFELADLYVSTITSRQQHVEKKKLTIPLPSARMFKYGAAAALIFGMLFISPKVTDIRQADNASLASISFVDTTTKSTLESSTIDTIYSINKENQLKTIEPASNKVTKSSTYANIDKFHVIVASLPTQKSANQFCEKLVDADFSDAKVLSPEKRYRVAIKSFSNKKDAILYMENLRKTDSRFETAWVLCH